MPWQVPHPTPPGGERISRRYVHGPQAHDGVGQALRSAYLPRISDMPRDLADLIDRLS